MRCGPAGANLHAHEAPFPSLPPWCREQYSAERMNLVLLGGEPLDTLQQVGKSGWWKWGCADVLQQVGLSGWERGCAGFAALDLLSGL